MENRSSVRFGLVAVAVPFWRSGQTKWTGWFELSDSTIYLFEEEFRIHLFGHEYAYPRPQLTACVSSVAEVILPVMLVLGLGTRFAALGIAVMTTIISADRPGRVGELPPAWFAMALAVMAYGPGKVSVDHLLARAAGGRGSRAF